jgi:hypothetical protein
MSDGGKGSAPRPFAVDQETFSDNWERIFGKKKKQSVWVDSQKQPDPKQDQQPKQ